MKYRKFTSPPIIAIKSHEYIEEDITKQFVDLVCENKIDKLLSPDCQVESLHAFAKLNNIKTDLTDTKKNVCQKISFKFEKDILENVISTAQVNINNLILKISNLIKDNKDLARDISQFQIWWTKNRADAEEAIKTENLKAVRDFKNLLRQNSNNYINHITSTYLKK